MFMVGNELENIARVNFEMFDIFTDVSYTDCH